MKKWQSFNALQWNIGGAPKLQGICRVIKELKPKIITLQEAHIGHDLNQIKEIAKRCGYKYWICDNYDVSHLDKTKMLSQGIISVFPLKKHSFFYFNLPRFNALIGNKNIKSHIHGLTGCYLDFNGHSINIKTLHSLAYYKFGLGLNSPIIKQYRKQLESKLLSKNIFIAQGDFNYDSKGLKKFLPKLFNNKTKEVKLTGPTTPKGKFFDHVIFSGLKVLKTKIISSVPTDHYPILTTFVINK